ncbi:MAG: protein kinase, partial [Desulfobacterales bacterium]|nr:protein kinase [Desulfobacterales bacterium]
MKTLLGRGGMGAVHLAERDQAGVRQKVAVKVLNQVLGNPDAHRRFRQEHQILARLEHPNIARLYDGGRAAGGQPFLVMEYVKGRTITGHCDAGRLSIRERIEIFLKVTDALAYAHQRLIVHRDIKPSNVMVTRDGVPKLLDFGIAKPLESLAESEELMQTAANMRLMTPSYASPEQIKRNIWPVSAAVGVLLFSLILAGVMTWQARVVAQQRDRAEAAEAAAVEQRTIAESAYQTLRRESYLAAIETADDSFETGLNEFAFSSLEKTPVELRNWEWGWLAEAPRESGQKRQPVQERMVHKGGVRTICFNSLGNRMLSAGMDGGLKIWDRPSGGPARTIKKIMAAKGLKKHASKGFITIVSDSRGSAVHALTADERVILFNPAHDGPSRLLDFQDRRVLAIAHSASDDAEINLLVAGTREGDVVLWDTARRAIKQTLPGSGVPITAVTVDRDASIIIAGQANGRAKVWAANPGKVVMSLDGHAGEITSVAISADGSLAVTGGADHTGKVWRLATGEPVFTIVGHNESLTAVGFSPDGERVLTGGLDGEVKVSDVRTGKEIMGLDEEHGLGPVHAAVFSPDGKTIVVGDAAGAISWFTAHP